MRTPHINDKLQFVGLGVQGRNTTVHVWLPAPDYGLAAGNHAFPVPDNGFEVPAQVLGFADNGSVLLGYPHFKVRSVWFSLSEGAFS